MSLVRDKPQTANSDSSLDKGQSCQKSMMPNCYTSIKTKFTEAFRRYGVRVGTYPLPFIIIPIVVFGGLGFGMFTFDFETDLETLYFPSNSRAINDRQRVRDLFPNVNDVRYDSFAQSDAVNEAILMFESKTNGSVFDNFSLAEIRDVVNKVKAIYANKSGQLQFYSDLCARTSSACSVEGEELLSQGFQNLLSAGLVSFPYWSPPNSTNTIDLSFYLSEATTRFHNTSDLLKGARVLKLSFKLLEGSEEWMKAFLSTVDKISSNFTEIYYGTTQSLSDEIDKGTKGDIYLFALTFTISITFASLVSTGGNVVSCRAILANAGVLAAGLGIVGALGLVSLCGVKFVNLVGVMPFLIIGIGVDDMFLLMSSWRETIEDKEIDVPQRLGATFATAGIGITVTSLTDFLSFIIGTTSVFRSVTIFSIYTGAAVLFCYICQATFFGGCLTLHTRRVKARRHYLTCRVTKSKEDVMKETKSQCLACMCGGSIPKNPHEDESVCEKLPRLTLPILVTNPVGQVLIIVGFLGYLAASIYGVINLPQGLVLYNLVPTSSYYHSYLVANEKYFPTRLPVAFVVSEDVDYTDYGRRQFTELISSAHKDQQIIPDFERCWLKDYVTSASYSNTSFVKNLRDKFLPTNPQYYSDLVFDSTNTSIVACRCYVMSTPIEDQYELADLMKRMRAMADDSALPAFAYHQSFVAFEQSLAVLPATLQMVGVALAAVFVVCVIFLPHPFMIVLITLTVAMILVGIFGFMYYWDTALSSITMIHLVMSVGFSVDFSAHVCSAYLMSDACKRKQRARDAISHAASAIFNGGASSLLGVILLVFSDSYIFVSFFRIMVLVIGFGMLHAVLFLPAVLSLIGPQNNQTKPEEGAPQYDGKTSDGPPVCDSCGGKENGQALEDNCPLITEKSGGSVKSESDNITQSGTTKSASGSQKENAQQQRVTKSPSGSETENAQQQGATKSASGSEKENEQQQSATKSASGSEKENEQQQSATKSASGSEIENEQQQVATKSASDSEKKHELQQGATKSDSYRPNEGTRQSDDTNSSSNLSNGSLISVGRVVMTVESSAVPEYQNTSL